MLIWTISKSYIYIFLLGGTMNLSKLSRPVWSEINLDNLAHNIREVRRITKEGVIVTAVVKADAYGHGAVEIGKVLLENGADRFAVASLSEAIQLRKSYTDVDILILGYTPCDAFEEVLNYDITQTIYTFAQAKELNDIAVRKGKIQKIHIKLDTGMSRLGMQISDDTISEIIKIKNLSNLDMEGIFTHFAVADEIDKEFTYRQVEKFNYIIRGLEEKGIDIPIKHVSNSASIIDLPEFNYNMVRAGIMLYGLYPSNEVDKMRVNLKEVMSLKARLSHVKDVQGGTGVSYGLKYQTKTSETIGTVPIGYADGFTRMYSFSAKGIVNGEKRPIVGRICMDQCMINITDLNAKEGDEVILFGEKEGVSISIDEVASYIGTINYEVVCMINKRVPRVYTSQGMIVKIRDYVLDLI